MTEKTQKTIKQAKEDKRAAALRANLRRRKEQSRSIKTVSPIDNNPIENNNEDKNKE